MLSFSRANFLDLEHPDHQKREMFPSLQWLQRKIPPPQDRVRLFSSVRSLFFAALQCPQPDTVHEIRDAARAFFDVPVIISDH
jgi:hypothetical protein